MTITPHRPIHRVGDHFDHHGVGTGWFIAGGIIRLLLLAALVVVIVWAVRSILQLRRTSVPAGALPSGRSPALDELELRYARGEIERSDYLQRRFDLGAAGPPPPPPPTAAPPTT